jgi:hypothetical protein
MFLLKTQIYFRLRREKRHVEQMAILLSRLQKNIDDKKFFYLESLQNLISGVGHGLKTKSGDHTALEPNLNPCEKPSR